MNIIEDYCSYEVAKLLKEKGFDEPYDNYYNKESSSKEQEPQELTWDEIMYSYDEFLKAPTHQMAMKWLREIYDLHIIAYPFKSCNDVNATHYCCQVFKTFNLLGCEKYTNETLTSYEEAVEAALKYALENLV